jgi:hypothetical protein
MDSGILIALVAILGGLAVPIVALIFDFKRRKLQFEERRAMIEKGMQPPPMEALDHRGQNPAARRDRYLRSGFGSLCMGLGLGLASYLMANVVPNSFIPHAIVGPMVIGASVLGFIGIGQLLYVFTTRGHGGA